MNLPRALSLTVTTKRLLVESSIGFQGVEQRSVLMCDIGSNGYGPSSFASTRPASSAPLPPPAITWQV